MKFFKVKKPVILKDEIKNTLLRHVFFTSLTSKGRRQLMLWKTNKYLHVGFSNKIKKVSSKYLLYKSLHLHLDTIKVLNKTDYLSVLKIRNKRDDFCLNFKQKRSVTGTFDLFYYNHLLKVKTYIPIFFTKFEYNLYDRNYRFLKFLNYLNLKNNNNLFLQSYDFMIFKNHYFFNLYFSIKHTMYIDLKTVLLNYYLYLNTNDKNNIFSIFKILRNTNLKYVKFSINNYIKSKNDLNIKHLKLLDKYLIKNKMFRSGKFFYNFLEYMKSFSYNVYRNNLFYRKYQYIKFDGNKQNVKLISFNVDKLARLKGWFYIYNYIKKYSYLSYNENKNKVISYFIKKYHFFYNFIIKFFYKIIKNLKFMFVEKFNFKKIQIFKIFAFYMFYIKWFKFKPLIRKIRRKKLKKWKIKRIKKFRFLGYIRFLVRIKARLLEARILKRMKLNSFIRKNKKLRFYKYKNTVRVVNWLIKLRRLKNIKNPFRKPFRKFKRRVNLKFNNNNNKKLFNLNKFNNFKQLSHKYKNNKDLKKPYPYYKNNKKFKAQLPLIKNNVKRV
jgi:hypothetical protein